MTARIEAGSAGLDAPARLGTKRLRRLVENRQWLVGAINPDEDLHFSSFYTRQSCRLYQDSDFVAFGYESLIAVYEDFNETYYVPRDECTRVAEALLARMALDPHWFQNILDQIYQRSDELRQVFPFDTDTAPFRSMTSEDLLKTYRDHTRAHRSLYQVSRIPEALDRGTATYTEYLKAYLKTHAKELAPEGRDMTLLFDLLTFPEEMSIARLEMAEFQRLIAETSASVFPTSHPPGSSKRAVLHLPPEVLGKIDRHRRKWMYWGYHGYGSRATPDVAHYVARMSRAGKDASTKAESEGDYARMLEAREQERMEAFQVHGVDETHRDLFRIHGRIGVAKLYRRFAQLRNFYYLDQLLAEIAARLAVTEAAVRSSVPEEIEAALAGHEALGRAQAERAGFAAHVIDGDAERILGGDKFRWIADRLRNRSHHERPRDEKVRGTTAQPGLVEATCRVIIRGEDAERSGFRAGDILVSVQTDPDLLDVIAEAGGVITEQGGVACHAAIVCRELGKPCLVGVEGLLDLVHTGDVVTLNADEGYLLLRSGAAELIVRDAAVAEAATGEVGAKSLSLGRLMRAGFRVPRFSWSR